MKKLFLIIALTIIMNGYSKDIIANKPVSIFEVFSDYEQTIPLQEPYHLLVDGKFSKYDMTDKKGRVLTDKRTPNKPQEFVLSIFKFPIYIISYDAKNKYSIAGVAAHYQEWENPCDTKELCLGKGFYWIRVVGIGSTFENEAYSLSINNHIFTGNISEEGYIFIPQNELSLKAAKISLQLCGLPVVDITSGVDLTFLSWVYQKESSNKINSLECKNSKMLEYKIKNSHFNQGRPYFYSMWSKGDSPVEIEKNKQEEKSAKLEEYKTQAANNDDALSWLGKLPTEWSEEEFEKRKSIVYEKIRKDLADNSYAKLQDFICKKVDEVGPIPDMPAVSDFLEKFPNSIYDAEIVKALNAVAAKGNWLAQTQMFLVEQSKNSDKSYLDQYRYVQLLELMQSHKYGALYRKFGEAVAASGYYGDAIELSEISPFDIFAAFHNSYPAQFDIGRALLKNNDTELQAVGKKMQDCALNALPVYKKIFKQD